VFTDAQTYAEHAGRTEVSLDDCKLAIQAKVNHSFTTPPPRQVCPFVPASLSFENENKTIRS